MIAALIDFLRTLTTPERLIGLLSTVLGGWYGYAALAGIVFAETGLLVGFFLPGDSLLFTVGVVAGAGSLNIFLINAVLMVAVIAGDSVGYFLGKRAGLGIFARPDSRFFKRDHLRRTQEFYEKHGRKTIIYARFVPIVRTFTPFLAGVADMGYGRFLSFSILAAFCWVPVLTTLGYVLGNQPLVRAHFEKAVLAVIALSFLPIFIEYMKRRRQTT